ncbi:MAG: hypothetical protein ACI8Y7_001150 [Candidatus Woesearchaeota archaeon]|jgi:hypothetical protein
MRIRKEYGNYKTDDCIICSKQAFTKNKDGLPVCKDHTNTKTPEYKCMCGSWIELKIGKYGAYANCIKCGNINLKKILEFNT